MSNTKITSHVIESGAVESTHIASGAISASHVTGITTANITENTNLYYTNARARSSISVTGGNLSYDSSTGVIQLTDSEIRDALSAGTGVTYSGGQISIGQAVGTSDTVTFGNITTAGYLRGPSTFTIDPASYGDNTGTLIIAGNLQVDGTTTTINSTTLTVDDLNITLASGAANAAAANGAGLTVDGASATITYDSTNDEWDVNKNVRAESFSVGAGPTSELLFLSGAGHNGHGTTNTRSVASFNQTGQSAGLWFGARSDETTGIIGTRTATGNLAFETYNGGWGERMRITSAGNVGIGTDSPGDIRLKVHSNDSDDYIAIFKQNHASNLGTVQIDTPSDSNARPSRLDFARGGVNKWKTGMVYGDSSNGWGLSDATGSGTALQQTRFLVQPGGNVGIAKTSLTTWSSGYNALQIGGRSFIGAHSSSDLYLGQNAYFNSGWKYEDSAAASLTQHSGGAITHFVTSAGTADNAITWTTGLHITPTGDVGIGTGSPDTLLELRKDTVSTSYGVYPTLSIRNDNATGFGAIHFQEGSTQRARIEVGNNSGSPYLGLHTGSGTNGIRVDSSGNVGIGTIAVTSPGLWYDANPGYLAISHWATPPTPAAMLHLSDNSNDIDVPQIRIEGRENPGDTRLDISVKDAGVRLNLIEGPASDANNGFGLMEFKTNAAATASYPTRGGFKFITPADANNLVITNTGKVGIGKTNPSAKLEVEGAFAGTISKFFDTGSNGGAQYNGGPVVGISRVGNGSVSLAGPLFQVGNDTSSSLSYNIDEAIFTVTNTGVGVGTATPGDTLVVFTDASNKGITIHSGSTSGFDNPTLTFIDDGNSTSTLAVKGDNFCFSTYNTTDAFKIIGNGGKVIVKNILDNTHSNTNISGPSTADHTLGTRQSYYDASTTAWYARGIESNTLWDNTDNNWKLYRQGSLRLEWNEADYRFRLHGNSAGIDFTGGNNRIYFAGARALEGNATTLQIGEGHTTGLYQMATNTFYGNVNPASDDTYDLGSSTQRWRNVYTGDLHLSNEGKEEGNEVDGTTGNWTIQEGEEHLFIINNKSGKKYRFALEEIE